MSLRDGIGMGKVLLNPVTDAFITHNGHLLLVEQIVRGKYALTQFTSESSHRFRYKSLRL